MNVNVRQRGAGALKFADLRDDLRAERHANLRRHFGDDLRRPFFVSGIAKTMEIAHADRFDTLIAQLCHQTPDEILVERFEFAAVGRNPLRHVEAQMTRHQRFGQFEI